MKQSEWSVGRVAQRSGVNVSTLHFYERKGLIQSWRNLGNQRRYKPDVLRRISVIKAAQAMGISLEEIRNALAHLPGNKTPTGADWSRLAKSWQADLNARIDSLQRLRDSLNGCIGCGCLSMKNCPIYNKDDILSKSGTGAVLLNRPSTKQDRS